MTSASDLRNEAQTRKLFIDEQLADAGWHVDRGNLLEEMRLTGAAQLSERPNAAYDAGDEFADYVLLGRDGKPVAVVEAKRTSRDALVGQGQAADYADRVRTQYDVEPFIFLANGREMWYWDRERYPPRPVTGFFTLDDLERFAFQRRYRLSLAETEINQAIINRLYQNQAVRQVTERMEAGQRRFLLVMATGTGKTRTVIALVDLLMRARWAQRVLFLADRRALVQQALRAFKEHIPDETRGAHRSR